MLFMVIERFRDRDMVPIYERVRDSGRMLPESLKYIESWVGANFGERGDSPPLWANLTPPARDRRPCRSGGDSPVSWTVFAGRKSIGNICRVAAK